MSQQTPSNKEYHGPYRPQDPGILNPLKCDECLRLNLMCRPKDATTCEECHSASKACTKEHRVQISRKRGQESNPGPSVPAKRPRDRPRSPNPVPAVTWMLVQVPPPPPAALPPPIWPCYECVQNGGSEMCGGKFPFHEDSEKCPRCVELGLICRPPPSGP
jgi:hypothetical protein